MSWLVAMLMIAGAFFGLVAALGVLRMPDIYMRMHAATKAGAFGASLMAIAAVLQFGNLRSFILALLLITFFYLTAPVAAQALGRAAYRRGNKKWEGTGEDALEKSGECEPTEPLESSRR